jgi:hypothetical protein
MQSVFSALIAYISHQALRRENMALRHQLAVYQHTVKGNVLISIKSFL